MLRLALAPLLLALSGIAGTVRADDLMIRQRVSGTDPSERPREETQYHTATRRIVDTPDSRMIIDLDAKSMTVMEKQRKAYRIVSFDEIRAQSDALRAQIDNLPDEIKKAMPPLDGDVTVKPTGKSDTLLGHPVKEYAISSGLSSGSVWITTDFTPPGDAKAWQDAVTTMSGPRGPGGKLAETLAKLEGVPLRSTFTTAAGNQKFTVTTEVTEIRPGTPPTEMSTIPSDFKKAERVVPTEPKGR